MTDLQAKMFPAPTPESEPYWQGCRNGELLLQQCAGCGHWQFYPRILCTACGGADVQWRRACGRGRVETYTVVHVPLSPAYAADAPYVVALVRLEEGPLMMSNLALTAPADARVGMAVEVFFEAWSDTVVMPQFRPAGSS